MQAARIELRKWLNGHSTPADIQAIQNIFAGVRAWPKPLPDFTLKKPFYGPLTRTVLLGRSRSFSATKDPSYYAAAGVASRANVLR